MKEKIELKYLVEKKSQRKIGEELGLSEWSVRKLMKEYGVASRPRGYIGNTNSDFFENIDSEEKAYILGFITADGGIDQKNGSVRLELKSEDEYILKKIVDIVAPGNKVSQSRGCSYITLCSKKLIQDLEKYGVAPKKSLILEKLSEEIPEKYYSHYIRGLFDGDGTVTMNGKYLRIGYNSGSRSFLEDYRRILSIKAGLSENGTYFGTVFFTSWGKKEDINKFYKYIYQNNPSLFLKRKFDKMTNYVNTEVT